MKATCLECKHRTSLLQVHWWNTATILNLWSRRRLTSLISTGLTSGSPRCSTCLLCTPQPIPQLPPTTTPLRAQPSPIVRVASTDDVTNARVRCVRTNRHLHGVLRQHRRRRRRRSTGLSTRKAGTWAAERRRRRVHSRYARTHVAMCPVTGVKQPPVCDIVDAK